jgi:hypothetical protein
MPVPGLLTALSLRDHAPILLVDFARTSDSPTLATLMRSRAAERGLYWIDGVQAYSRVGGGPGIEELAEQCVRALGDTGPAIATVAGYCSAAVLALRIWERLRADGTQPTLSLIDPVFVDDDLIGRSFADLRAAAGGGPARSAGSAESGVGDPPASGLEAMLAVLADDLGRRLKAEGSDADEIQLLSQILLERYAAWLGFLCSARAASLPAPGAAIRVVLSTEGHLDLPVGWSARSVETVRLDQPADQALTSDRLAGLLAGQSESRSAGDPIGFLSRKERDWASVNSLLEKEQATEKALDISE